MFNRDTRDKCHGFVGLQSVWNTQVCNASSSHQPSDMFGPLRKDSDFERPSGMVSRRLRNRDLLGNVLEKVVCSEPALRLLQFHGVFNSNISMTLAVICVSFDCKNDDQSTFHAGCNHNA